MAKINVDYQTLISYGKDVQSLSSEYQNEINNIYSIVDDLKRTWTGTAAERFTSNIEKYKSDYEKFGKTIQQFGELLESVGRDYQRIEDEL